MSLHSQRARSGPSLWSRWLRTGRSVNRFDCYGSAIFARFKLRPGLFFNHNRVGIQVLPLQTDFFQLLCQTSFLFSLLFLFLFNLSMNLKKALFTSYLSFRCQCSCIILFLLSACIILGLPSIARHLNLLCPFHKLNSLFFLACQVFLSLELYRLTSCILCRLLNSRHFSRFKAAIILVGYK